MINLSSADDFLKGLEEKNKRSEKSEIEEAIKMIEQTLDKFGNDFDRLERRVKAAGIGEGDMSKIKEELKGKVKSILKIY
jgi:archaellum component FlaC